jgi:hypothetical protein
LSTPLLPESPLICADGSLHIVELKGPGARLVRAHRGSLIVADEVHEAVSQCLNYLRSLDETGATLQRCGITKDIPRMTSGAAVRP